MKKPRKILIEVDEVDYCAIQKAIALRQCFGVMPGFECGNLAGRVLAEICRGWMEEIGLTDLSDEKG